MFQKWVPARPQISSSKYVLVRQKNGTLKPLSVSNLPFHMILGPIFFKLSKKPVRKILGEFDKLKGNMGQITLDQAAILRV